MNIQILQQKFEPTWKSAYKILPRLIRSHGFKIGVELGVAFGGHSEAILKNTDVKKLYGVDPYRNLTDYQDPLNLPQKDFDSMYRFVQKRMRPFGTRYKHIRRLSYEALPFVPCNLDFIYIDANHSYEGVTEDIRTWFSKISDGGIISGHDYGHPNFQGVKKAIDEYFNRFSLKINFDKSGVWWVKKEKMNISFIMPAYNCELTISESIKSIIEGNFTSGDELIIVNDGSSDGTQQVLNNLKKQFSMIKIIIHKKNKGGGSARNTAVKNALNEIIFCLDADNVLYPNSVPKLKKYMIEKNVDAAAFGKVHFFKKNIKNITHKWIYKERITIYDVINNAHQTPYPSGNYLFTKDSWTKANGYPEFSGALDTWGFGFRQLATNSKMIVMPNSYYNHRYGYNSYWVRESKKNNISLLALKILKPYFELFCEKDIKYITSKEGKYRWFDKLDKRPLHLKNYQNSSLIFRVKKIFKKLLKK